jgi:ABC-type Fe3+-hydroxamate transport system substrate-binding protein
VSLVLAALAVAAGIRIVSLAPALTEDLFAIGAGPNVVGVDAFSDRPAAARRLPRVGGMRDVNAEAVVALRPDIVVGIPYEAVHLADVARGGVRTEALPLDDLRDDLHAIERLGKLTGREAAARRVTQRIRERLASLASAAARTRRLTAFVSLGGMGTAGGGSYVDELLGLANLHNVTGAVKRPWVTFSPEDLLHAQPDVIIVPDRGPALEGEPWAQLAAVKADRIVRVPEDDLLRPGPRVADVLAELIAGLTRWR